MSDAVDQIDAASACRTDTSELEQCEGRSAFTGTRLEGRSRTLFIDIGSRFLKSDGTLSRLVMPDLVHLSTRGYRIWADAMEKPLQSLLQ